MDDGASPFDVRALLDARAHEGFELHARYLNPQMPKVLRTLGFDRQWVRAEGATLIDADGTTYLDLLSGFGVFALGRCHPVIQQALRDALGARSRISFRWSARPCPVCSPRRSSHGCRRTTTAASSPTAVPSPWRR